MQIRSKYDVTIIVWGKDVVREEEEQENDQEEKQVLLAALDHPSEDAVQIMAKSPVIRSLFSGQHGKTKHGGGGGAGALEEEEETDFPDLRDVPFSVSKIVWNYVEETRGSYSIKRSSIQRLFHQQMDFREKTWLQIEMKTIQSVMQTFQDLPGEHGIYTLYWTLHASKNSFRVRDVGEVEPLMSTFGNIDEDLPAEMTWFRMILEIVPDEEEEEDEKPALSFKGCTFNFLLSRQERIVFGWTCADIVEDKVFERFRDFFVQRAFNPIFEEIDGNNKNTGWTFLFSRSFRPIIQSNLIVHEILRQTPYENLLVLEAALELAVDLRMIHSLLQTNGFRTSFYTTTTPYLKSFLKPVFSKWKKDRGGAEDLDAKKVWKTILHFGTHRKKGVSLPVFTAFLYNASLGIHPSSPKDEGEEKEEEKGKKEEEEDPLQELISHQLDVADSWNQLETLKFHQQSKVLSLTVDDASSFLMALIDDARDDAQIMREFPANELTIEESLRVMFPSMFFVNEMPLFYRKLVEMETELRLAATTAIEKNRWLYFLVPVFFCRKPVSTEELFSSAETSTQFWQHYGISAFYLLIGKMNSSSAGGETQETSSYALLNFFPFSPEQEHSFAEWQSFLSQESMETMFPLQKDIVMDEAAAEEEDGEEEGYAGGSGGHQEFLLDRLLECLDRSFLSVQSNQDLISPMGWSMLMEEQDDEDVMKLEAAGLLDEDEEEDEEET